MYTIHYNNIPIALYCRILYNNRFLSRLQHTCRVCWLIFKFLRKTFRLTIHSETNKQIYNIPIWNINTWDPLAAAQRTWKDWRWHSGDFGAGIQNCNAQRKHGSQCRRKRLKGFRVPVSRDIVSSQRTKTWPSSLQSEGQKLPTVEVRDALPTLWYTIQQL